MSTAQLSSTHETRPELTRLNNSFDLENAIMGGTLEDTPSLTMSSTPPTSMDTSSDTTDAPNINEKTLLASRPSRARRSHLASYNINVLAGTARHGRRSIESVRRDISGETLVNDPVNGSGENLLGESIKALNLDWSVDALSGTDSISQQNDQADALKRRRSTRQDLVNKVKSGLTSGISVLGKRGREAISKGKDDAGEAIQNLKKRTTLRPRVPEKADEVEEQQPVAKKLRFADEKDDAKKTADQAPVEKASLPPKAKEKRWLSQGLYVGQDRIFDGRLTESQNRAKIAAKHGVQGKERKILPMPMFLGQKLLERGRDFKLPFDVFSPLPPGQPKPDEWKKCRRNVFIGDAASIWKDTILQEDSRCLCTPETGCDENCLNRYMLYECDDNNCNNGELCSNRSFAALKKRCKKGGKYDIGVEVMKTPQKGYGVRSNRSFQPGQIIVEYAGEIITQDECDTRMEELYKDNECYYLMLFDQNMIIDATRGSIARFINHSCEPNCKMVKWIVAGKPRMALFAGDKGVMTGEELTYDYKFEAFSIKNDQVCHCGAASCRGWLGGRPKEAPKEPKEALSALVNSRKRKVQDILQSSRKASKQKKEKLAKPKVTDRILKTTTKNATKRISQIRQIGSTTGGKRGYRISTTQTTPKRLMGRGSKTIRSINTAVKAHNSGVKARTSGVKHGKGKGPVNASAAKPRSATRAVASVRRNVVTTVRGPRRAAALARAGNLKSLNGNGSTIKIIDNV